MAKRSGNKWHYGYGINKSSSSSLHSLSKIASRRVSPKVQRTASYSLNKSSSVSKKDNSGCGVVLGILCVILFGVLILCSFPWSWESTEVNYWGHVQTTDWRWLKWIFYPITISGFLFGLFGLTVSLSNTNQHNTTQGIKENEEQKIIEEIRHLILELDSFKGDTDVSYQSLVHTINKIKELATPLINICPDVMISDVKLVDFIEDADSLVNERRNGRCFENSFEGLIHKIQIED